MNIVRKPTINARMESLEEILITHLLEGELIYLSLKRK